MTLKTTAETKSSARPKSSARAPKLAARRPKTSAPDPLDVSRRFTVRRRVITESTWQVPEGIGGRQEAREYAQEGMMKPQRSEVVSEHWFVEQESKSDVVRRLTVQGLSANEITKLTGWDYSFVYGVSWRDAGGR